MNRKGISLIELLIAVTLISVVGLAIVSIDFASRMGFIQAGKRAKVSDEARFAMGHITRHIRLANRINPTSGNNLTQIQIWIDDDKDPSNFSNDTMLTYSLSGNQILFSDTDAGITNEVIAQGVTSCDFTVQDGTGSVPVVTISITVVDRPTPPPPLGSPNNPRVTLESKASLWCKGRS
jgi:Tfp pilus assembly protein PilW